MQFSKQTVSNKPLLINCCLKLHLGHTSELVQHSVDLTCGSCSAVCRPMFSCCRWNISFHTWAFSSTKRPVQKLRFPSLADCSQEFSFSWACVAHVCLLSALRSNIFIPELWQHRHKSQGCSSDHIYFDNKRRTFNEAVSYFAVVAPAGCQIKYVRNVTFSAQIKNKGRESECKKKEQIYFSKNSSYLCIKSSWKVSVGTLSELASPAGVRYSGWWSRALLVSSSLPPLMDFSDSRWSEQVSSFCRFRALQVNIQKTTP